MWSWKAAEVITNLLLALDFKFCKICELLQLHSVNAQLGKSSECRIIYLSEDEHKAINKNEYTVSYTVYNNSKMHEEMIIR